MCNPGLDGISPALSVDCKKWFETKLLEIDDITPSQLQHSSRSKSVYFKVYNSFRPQAIILLILVAVQLELIPSHHVFDGGISSLFLRLAVECD